MLFTIIHTLLRFYFELLFFKINNVIFCFDGKSKLRPPAQYCAIEADELNFEYVNTTGDQPRNNVNGLHSLLRV